MNSTWTSPNLPVDAVDAIEAAQLQFWAISKENHEKHSDMFSVKEELLTKMHELGMQPDECSQNIELILVSLVPQTDGRAHGRCASFQNLNRVLQWSVWLLQCLRTLKRECFFERQQGPYFRVVEFVEGLVDFTLRGVVAAVVEETCTLRASLNVVRMRFAPFFSWFPAPRKRNGSSNTCVASVTLLDGLALVRFASHAEPRCLRR